MKDLSIITCVGLCMSSEIALSGHMCLSIEARHLVHLLGASQLDLSVCGRGNTSRQVIHSAFQCLRSPHHPTDSRMLAQWFYAFAGRIIRWSASKPLDAAMVFCQKQVQWPVMCFGNRRHVHQHEHDTCRRVHLQAV